MNHAHARTASEAHLSSQAAVPFRLLSWRHWACSPAWVASGGEEPPSEGVLRIHSDWMPPLPPTCERGAWTHNSVNPMAAGCIQLQCNSGIAAHEGWQLSTPGQAPHLHHPTSRPRLPAPGGGASTPPRPSCMPPPPPECPPAAGTPPGTTWKGGRKGCVGGQQGGCSGQALLAICALQHVLILRLQQ